MIDKIKSLKAEINALAASNIEEVEALRIKYISKKGLVTALFNDFRQVPPEQKREVGQALNELKNLATDKINSLRESLDNVDTIDTSLD
ncbi:MAG: phenylalanine--tRNA ligase subunit alpha, partial [Paramuribaculum sp.]|nr:phenylalanine--tRNA ligase subunit alpha [Paramuribaculum sp.]